MKLFVLWVILTGMALINSSGYSSSESRALWIAQEAEKAGFHSTSAPYFEFQSATGKWFCCSENKAIFALSSSAGAHKPGTEIGIHLYSYGEELKVNRDIVFKLTERNADSSYKQTLDITTLHYTTTASHPAGYSITLPAQEGSQYFLSAEVMNGNGVEDTLLTSIEVPIQSVTASMHTQQPLYEGNERVILVVENQGPTAIEFGLLYTLETLSEGEWTEVKAKGIIIFPMIGIGLKSGTWEQKTQWDELAPGHYRFVKEISAEGTDIKQRLYAEFDVAN
ncbi:hypothetical protein SAMN03159341_104161 [Paenibacillus sp. 1_12]|uniref:immunoglobulin-like domain-containing protein n=1 Tax=Paenibacillus sp. 1_12 TaxID=1566278 RepID=UPI0008F17273|nr:immunoglobulin-like domain-containing protein [Paenibacillus sp. 1_12]SFL23383.1 hypothetical protein SAMN03159341_104161 [Paenibacillus sp. 1_12]